MYTVNGICYADEPENTREIQDAEAIADGKLLLTFSDGERRIFDTALLKGSAFEALRDPKVFETVRVEEGIVTWLNGELDCAPEFMYQNSEKI